MSPSPRRPMTIRKVLRRKGKRPLSMLTAYDAPTAHLLDEAGVDMILVGDSVGNVVLGQPDTLGVTVDDIVHHCAAVTRGAQRPLVVADMPFMGASISRERALENAARLVSEGRAAAVKIEGAGPLVPTIEAIVQAGIPVMGHLGLTPQFVHALGGYRYQGKTDAEADAIVEAARALDAAGVFSIVLECVPAEVAARVTEAVDAVTIGIGAGEGCDGQVLVFHDLLGLNPGLVPSFVKPTADLRGAALQGLAAWIEAVNERRSTPELGDNPSAEGAV